ncbi:YHS domain-containing protein [Nitrosopumilus adriaticus]|uniref:YHS domain protein n=1 Tax=Nitrosopumilus adriaticus TaxID=1580092 RepID=A0A0D5C0R6_9ARCH|nr:YHS domain-containing protein [Nitrosopumilus adriaticus]AJW69915.1 YHS domain protein [Nitrosopumilus adriaticus]
MKDPVCGMEMGEKGEVFSYKGKEYRFCCASCRWAFENNPEHFENES